MSDTIGLTPGLQCCLLCGRTLTDRVLHDKLEEPVLAAIRAEHPEWLSDTGECDSCVHTYRRLLKERLNLFEEPDVQTPRHLPTWMKRLLGRNPHTTEQPIV